jgi:hypothetical protein
VSRTAIAVLGFVCLVWFAIPMSAQLIPHGNVYVGALYGKSDYVTNYYGFKGWQGSAEFMPFTQRSYLGFVLDGSGLYRSGITQYNLLFGPRLSMQRGRWRPFVQGEGGIERVNSAGNTYYPVAWDVGAGADYKLSGFWKFKNFSWRLEGDYTHSRLLSASQHELRASTGLVWRF